MSNYQNFKWIKKKISLQDFILKIEIELNNEIIEVYGKIIGKYNDNVDTFLIAFRSEDSELDKEKKEKIKQFIKTHNPQIEKF